MESILYHLVNHIKGNMPQLSLVDEDYGQLEVLDDENTDMYPITFPAVLINTQETEWTNIGGKSQKGTAAYVVRLIIDCYDDTHYGSGTMEAMLQRDEMVNELHRHLQCFRPVDDGELVRTKSKFYTWSHGIKVYEMTYTIAVTDVIRETKTADAPRRVAISVGKL